MKTITTEVLAEARRLRDEEGFSLTAAARRLHISRSTLSNYSEGRVCADCGTPISARGGNPTSTAERCSACVHAYQIRWPAARIIAAIREWAALYGQPPAATDWAPQIARTQRLRDVAAIFERFYETPGRWPAANTVIARFGTWNGGITAAGFEPRGVGRPRQSRAVA